MIGGKNLPVIDTLVLFAAADSTDKFSEKGLSYLNDVNTNRYWFIPSFAILEFDLVLKSRGYSESDRMKKYALLISDYPNIEKKIIPVTPRIIHETARIESLYDLDYFDAGMIATALILDKKIATVDKELASISEIEIVWD